jgi:acetolactate synthase I/II/III large subunit
MKLSDYVIDFLIRQGVKHVFMLPGGGAMHLNDSLGEASRSGRINFVCNLHEQASAMAAETYAKAIRGLGVCMVTTGPGGTNTVTGVAGAWLDSIPVLFISGQAKRPDLKGGSGIRQGGLQEVDIVSIVSPITKYAVTVMEPRDIRKILEKAVFEAGNGRSGPVWVDIPLDVQAATIDPEQLEPFVPLRKPEPIDLPEKVRAVIELLNRSERPVILAGNGIRLAHAEGELRKLMDLLQIPVLGTWLSVDFFDYDDPLYIGKPGTVAPRGVNFTYQNCDLLLAIGSRVDTTLTAYAPRNLARGARKVMVDIDPAELKKHSEITEIAILSDAGDFLREFLKQGETVEKKPRAAWWYRCRTWKKSWPLVDSSMRDPGTLVSVYHFADVLSDELRDDELIASCSSGSAIEIFQHALRMKKGQRLFHTSALGSMGYGLPAAIGACLGYGGRETVCVEGDGGIQMNIQELATVERLQLPIKIFILSNNGYSSIRSSQKNWFGRVTAADPASGMKLPDITKVGAAYGLPVYRIADQSKLREEIRRVLDTPGPIVCEVCCIPEEPRMPSTASAQRKDGSLYSKPMEDLWPFLDREEFRANMIVPPLPEE